MGIHNKLYHYTSKKGLTGILTSQVLRATHFRDLNDSTECNEMIRPLKSMVEREVKDFVRVERHSFPMLKKLYRDPRKFKKLISEEASTLVDIPLSLMFEREVESGKESFYHPFIVSFCSHAKKSPYVKRNGLLSQWRAYGGKGGYAIVFNSKKLAQDLELELDRYLYVFRALEEAFYNEDNASLATAFPKEVAQFRRTARAMMESYAGKIEEADRAIEVDKSYESIATMASLFKHQGFFEEEETRIVVAPWTEKVVAEQLEEDVTHLLSQQEKRVKPIKSECGRKFIELFDRNDELPISRIIVGPSRDQEKNFQYVKELTKNKIRISRSKTPLR